MGNQISDRIGEEVKKKIAVTDAFLVEVKTVPGKISVLVDTPQGITINDCTDIARHLQKTFNDSDLFEKHELEVSSPGMEEPLKVIQQYRKTIGQETRVLKKDGKVISGVLTAASDEGIEVEVKTEQKVNKKKVIDINKLYILFNDIKETKIIFNFK
jgi:ribosome maturation factor RimP